jgi:hypothetical protein
MPGKAQDRPTDERGPLDNFYTAEDFVWGTDEKATRRARSLYVIRSIVEKHGGTVDIDVEGNKIDIDVPEEERLACAQEIEEHIGGLCS